MSTESIGVIRNELQQYADRGVFRAFHDLGTRRGKTEFDILCFPITQKPFRLVYSDATETLTFASLLSGMPAKSDMYREFKAFMKERSSTELPSHRRVDPERTELTWANRKGNVSVSLKVIGSNHEYATKKSINLLTDIFLDLLTESPFYEFMEEHFEMPED